jgi:hypothetical protein
MQAMFLVILAEQAIARERLSKVRSRRGLSRGDGMS